MLRVLVTGSAGYIGSTLVHHLISADHAVIAIDNFMYGQTPFNDLCYDPDFTIVKGDCRDMRLMRPLIEKADVIIPLAAIVGAPACDKDEHAAVTTNFDVVKSLVKLLSQEQQLIIPITNSGYGIGQPGVPCTEESPLKPLSLYGRLKVEAEEVAMAHPNATSLRLATVCGMSPRMRLDLLVNDFVWRAVNDRFVVLFEPHFKRNYIHVRDVAETFLHVIRNRKKMAGQVYNVGLSNANLSKMELCEAIHKHVPKFTYLTAEVGNDPDKRDYIVSNEKLEATGWLPQWDLDFGIQELIKGYQQFRRPWTNV